LADELGPNDGERLLFKRFYVVAFYDYGVAEKDC